MSLKSRPCNEDLCESEILRSLPQEWGRETEKRERPSEGVISSKRSRWWGGRGVVQCAGSLEDGGVYMPHSEPLSVRAAWGPREATSQALP